MITQKNGDSPFERLQQLVAAEQFEEAQELLSVYPALVSDAGEGRDQLQSALKILNAKKAHYSQELSRLQVNSTYCQGKVGSGQALDIIG